jgi:release factor glutamine methyltransferase
MILRALYNLFLNELKVLYNEDEAAVITLMVFECLAGFNRQAIISLPLAEVNDTTQKKLNEALAELKNHKPVQYVTGSAWFYQLQFNVTPAVLIPRPETEELVSAVIDFCKKEAKTTLLDIGTGSGCIPIAVKKNLEHMQVSAIDISEDALQVAKENALLHAEDIRFECSNFLNEKTWKNSNFYDVLVSNPPYIPEDEKQRLDKNVTAYEPHLALFVPVDNRLIFYEKIARFGKQHLLPGGKIFMETHELYAKEVAEIFAAMGYEIIIQKDFYEKERFVFATHSR